MNTPLLPPSLMAYSSSRTTSPYSFSVRNHDPLFSGLVDQLVPLRPTSTPSSTVHWPPCIATQPVRSRPLNRVCEPGLPFRQQQPANVATIRARAQWDLFMADVISYCPGFWPASFVLVLVSTSTLLGGVGAVNLGTSPPASSSGSTTRAMRRLRARP